MDDVVVSCNVVDKTEAQPPRESFEQKSSLDDWCAENIIILKIDQARSTVTQMLFGNAAPQLTDTRSAPQFTRQQNLESFPSLG